MEFVGYVQRYDYRKGHGVVSMGTKNVRFVRSLFDSGTSKRPPRQGENVQVIFHPDGSLSSVRTLPA